jgi:integrase
MVSLRQDSKGNFIARKRLPDDVREEYGRLYGARFEAKFLVRASLGKQIAQQKFHQWATEVEQRIEAIRKAQRGEGIDLDRKNAAALAGQWYEWFVARYEDEPGDPVSYEEALWGIIEAMRDFAPDEVREQPLKNMDWARDPEVRKGIRPVLADLGHTAQFLASRGVALTNKAHALFLDFALDNYLQALPLLERRAKGDYEPDELPKSFPQFTPQSQRPATGLSPQDLFDGWIKARQPAHSTIESWSTVFNALTRDFSNRPASTIKPEEAQEWLDKLVTEERSAFTVRNTWLRAAKTIYAWAAKRKLLTTNPFADAVVDVPKRKQHRPKWFYEHERATILKAASAIGDTGNPDDAARRWVPWLLAYTGARPGEITQLRGIDVERVDGVWTLNLTPAAGTIKGREARRVPVHAHLVEQGFIKFAQRHGDGPLFYRSRNNGPTYESAKQRKAPAAQTRQRLANWVREIEVDDEHLSPNHAWRHTFKLIGSRAEISDALLDYICGHAPATEGRRYGAPDLKDMARAIERFPRYQIDDKPANGRE